VPKQHIPYLEDLGEETGASMFRAAHRLARALRRSGLRCEGVNLFLADGEAAFQEVFHTHLHVFPRYGGDSFRIDADWGTREKDELDAAAAQVLSGLRTLVKNSGPPITCSPDPFRQPSTELSAACSGARLPQRSPRAGAGLTQMSVPCAVRRGGTYANWVRQQRLELAAFDAQDTQRLAQFYVDLAGWEILRNDGGWINVRTSDGQQIGFQPAPNYALPQWPGQEHPQQFHLDLFVEGREAAAERAVSLGAARLATGPTWITLTDPAGHPFDLCEKDGIGTAVQLFAVTIDAPTRRHWLTSIPIYSDLLGMELTYEGPGGGADRRRQEFDVPADQRLQRAPLAGPGAPAAGPPGHHSRRSRRRRGTSPGVGRNAGSAAAGSSSEPSPIRPATRSTSPGSSPGEVGNERP